ncbi:MAG TPA: glycerol kinase GlpK [Terriglobia bacterium]|nr:glycerol kinase GlpK [Terriglobia bacterium]
MSKYVLALDQGTTSSRAILFDRDGQTRAAANQEFKQYYPQPGWVEHDAEEIWQSQRAVAERVLAEAKAGPEDVAAIGITNQRETVVLWDRATGEPVHHAIVWQCRRTAPMCDRLRAEGYDKVLRSKTGLMTDAYFSGTKIAWLLENASGVRARAERGELAAGTIDAWLIWKLSGGKVHSTDVTNASRTLVFNINSLEWDEEILKHFKIPRALLPQVKESSGVIAATEIFGGRILIAGVAGDQQASLFGHQCFAKGSAKNTYGTGLFLLMNAGEEIPKSESGLVATVGWGRNGKTTYALEGSVFIAGAALQWLRDEVGLIKNAAESEAMAQAVADSNGVYFVPAFVGLGAPHWDAYARGTIVGLTRGSNRNHIVRAALESIAYQTREVVDAMAKDTGARPAALRVDGGAARNDFLCQFQADILGIPVERPATTEATALGTAYLAGLATGFWKDEKELAAQLRIAKRFEPAMPESRCSELYEGWLRAVDRAKGWARPGR